ncbi:MAG: hypothetical protein QM627_05630 [Luteolibacter sp.]
MRFRLSALLVLMIALGIPSAIGVLVYSLVIENREISWIAIGMFGGLAICAAWQWLLANHAKCPLCHVPSISHKRCSRHRNAKRLFGSFRFRVAASILLQNSFRCPYCGERSALELRRHHRSYSQAQERTSLHGCKQ